jgi:hypothetical protein
MAASLKGKRTPITTLHTKYLVLILLQTPLFSRWSLPLSAGYESSTVGKLTRIVTLEKIPWFKEKQEILAILHPSDPQAHMNVNSGG